MTRAAWSALKAIAGLGEIVLIAYAFPLAILALGIPIALLVRIAMLILHAV